MPPCRDNVKDANVDDTNIIPPFPNQEVMNAKFYNTIQVLFQTIANQANQHTLVPRNSTSRSTTTRVRDSVRMNLPNFLGSTVGKDPQNLIDEVKRTLGLMK